MFKNLSYPSQSIYLKYLYGLSIKLSQNCLKPTLMIHEQMNMRNAPRVLRMIGKTHI